MEGWLTSSGMRRASSIWATHGHLAEHPAAVDLLKASRSAVSRAT
jgi:hypothetical protein